MAKSSFKSLLRDAIEAVRDSSVPVKAVDYDPRTKHLRVEFDREPAPSLPVSIPLAAAGSGDPPPAPPAVKMVPGTDIPDDGTPVDALAIAAARPAYSMNGT